MKNRMCLIPQLAASLSDENKHDDYYKSLDFFAPQRMGGRYVRKVTHLEDALHLWLQVRYIGKRGHPLES